MRRPLHCRGRSSTVSSSLSPLSIGLGLQLDPMSVQSTHETVRILLTSGLLPAALIAIVLNLRLPEELADESVEEVSGGLSGHMQGSIPKPDGS